jgi:Carboxypeptidase regulatory-like domain
MPSILRRKSWKAPEPLYGHVTHAYILSLHFARSAARGYPQRVTRRPSRGSRAFHHLRFLRRELFLLPAILLCLAGSAWGHQESTPRAAAGLSGSVTDSDGGVIVGAQVRMHLHDANTDSITTTDADGHFQFSGVPVQHVDLSVKADGFSTGSASATLQPNQVLELEPIKLGAAASMDIEVGALTQEELAEQQIHVEEHQRLLGILPNFFVSYTWKAAPLTAKQKFELSWKTTLDPVNILIAAGTAGVEQAQDHFEEYKQGVKGYAKRFGANYADVAIGTFIGGAILPSLLHQDPRYFYKGTGSVWSRAGYALSTSVICRGDNGRWQPGYSSILGDFAAGAASNLYYPSNDRTGFALTMQNGLISVAFDAFGNLLQEFVFHHFTLTFPKPKPAPTSSNP